MTEAEVNIPARSSSLPLQQQSSQEDLETPKQDAAVSARCFDGILVFSLIQAQKFKEEGEECKRRPGAGAS